MWLLLMCLQKLLKRFGFDSEEALADAVNALNNSIHSLMDKIQRVVEVSASSL